MLSEYLNHILTKISLPHINVLLLLGLALFGGTVGGRIFQKIKIPQVVGYIVIGIIAGQSGFNIIDKDIIKIFEPFNYFALGLIGFMIGGELKKDVFAKYGRQFITILLWEGLAAFLAVFLLVGILGSLFIKPGISFWILGLLLGAIASATAPAATTDVLWEYRTRGPLTTTILGIVAMDDALALLLFAFASAFAGKLLGDGQGIGIFFSIAHPVYEIGASIIIGALFGLILTKILKRYTENERILAFSVGVIMLVLGLSLAIKVDMLLAAMVLGAVVVNRTPIISKQVFRIISGFTPPIYVLFFVLVGAKLNFAHMNTALLLLVVIYVSARTLGKMAGAHFGAKVSGAPDAVKKYLPLCLFSQAGVAIGLSIVAYHAFPSDVGNSIVLIITASTFIVQIIGPPAVKFAVVKANEAGKNITEEDLIRKLKVKDVMDSNLPVIFENMPLPGILDIFSKNDNLYYPVIANNKKLLGIITVESIKQTFMEKDLSNFFLACDLMEPAFKKISVDEPVLHAREIFDKYNLEYLPVIDQEDNMKGFIERRKLNKFISTKMMEFQGVA
ncbi:MAG: sodium:proton exchanger [Candidatus Omnitrophica bacterium CG11_big_fil_rev_8_21_14_0_20_42_13]|uniref:Sodium:proton exchanger n=1 Tax=Candidatus Ghiorseimicrobium undicola TaxID=1974746 RepID=A0A2H0LZA7_9BACT|nr:MAG: sodium:proton exchanger [Candidatus Omnitrophica bacterium CG11_big_fil_rev_8_21_14_0_20_42_13]